LPRSWDKPKQRQVFCCAINTRDALRLASPFLTHLFGDMERPFDVLVFRVPAN
jgi:hypothetical protein